MSSDTQSASSVATLASFVPKGAGAHPLQQAAMRLGEARDGRSRLKAKDLVGLLLCHGARAWRSSQPIARTRVRALGPSGKPSVRLRLG